MLVNGVYQASGVNRVGQTVVEFIRGVGIVVDGGTPDTSQGTTGPWTYTLPTRNFLVNMVGGGGGGGGGNSTATTGGGGGGGGSGDGFQLQPVSLMNVSSTTVTVTVGAGGTAGTGGGSPTAGGVGGISRIAVGTKVLLEGYGGLGGGAGAAAAGGGGGTSGGIWSQAPGSGANGAGAALRGAGIPSKIHVGNRIPLSSGASGGNNSAIGGFNIGLMSSQSLSAGRTLNGGGMGGQNVFCDPTDSASVQGVGGGPGAAGSMAVATNFGAGGGGGGGTAPGGAGGAGRDGYVSIVF